MAIDNSLQIFLFQQGWNEVIKLSLVRVFLSVKLIQSLRPFGKIAPAARPYLVMYPLDMLACLALQPNLQRLRYDMLFVQVAFAPTVYTSLVALDKLPVLPSIEYPVSSIEYPPSSLFHHPSSAIGLLSSVVLLSLVLRPSPLFPRPSYFVLRLSYPTRCLNSQPTPFSSIKNAVLVPRFDFLPNHGYIYVANLIINWWMVS